MNAAVMDWSRLEEFQRMEAEGMPGLAARLVRSYLGNSARVLGELQVAMNNADIEGVCRAAHSIKSTSANVGANTLSQLARMLEHATKAAAWLPAQADVDRIVAAHQAVVAALIERYPD